MAHQVSEDGILEIPGAPGERHQRRELRQRDDVGDLVEEQPERRVEDFDSLLRPHENGPEHLPIEIAA
jgi:hypothetical protein